MSEILTAARKGFKAVDIVALREEQRALPLRHVHMVSVLREEVGAFERRLLKESAGAFPIEQRAVENLKKAAGERRAITIGAPGERVHIEAEVKVLGVRAQLGAFYPEIFIDHLPLVDEDHSGSLQAHTMRLAILPLEAHKIWPEAFFDRKDTPTCYGTRTNEQALRRIYDAYKDAIRKQSVPTASSWYRFGEHEHSIHCAYYFPGLIPSEVRAKIIEARPHFKDGEISLLIDVESLQANPNEKIYDRDPLVIGWHLGEPDSFWLIAAFDMTTIEQLVHDTARAAHNKLREDMLE